MTAKERWRFLGSLPPTPVCQGSGYRVWDERIGRRRYCECAMGKELGRAEVRLAMEQRRTQANDHQRVYETLKQLDEGYSGGKVLGPMSREEMEGEAV